MTTFLCGAAEMPGPVASVLAGMLDCCLGALEDGPTGCTCWTSEYDQDQAPAKVDVEPVVRARMCDDCAFRADSPERAGDERYTQPHPDPKIPFWCHDGLRRVARYRHPLGITVEAETGDDYTPLICRNDDGVSTTPYRADGLPAFLCAGWAAQKARS